MKNKYILVMALSALFGGLQAGTQTFPYQVKLLGINDGRTGIQIGSPTGLNRWGQVIGTYGSTAKHAALWTPNFANDGSDADAGTFYSLESAPGIPVGTAQSAATGINDRGQVVGGSYTPGHGDGNQSQSWMWKPAPLNSNQGKLGGKKGKAVTFAAACNSRSRSTGGEQRNHQQRGRNCRLRNFLSSAALDARKEERNERNLDL